MEDAEFWSGVVGALLLAAGWLAGRNRKLAKTMQTMVSVYESLVKELRTEIDRLRVEVADLRKLLPARSSTVRNTRQ